MEPMAAAAESGLDEEESASEESDLAELEDEEGGAEEALLLSPAGSVASLRRRARSEGVAIAGEKEIVVGSGSVPTRNNYNFTTQVMRGGV